MIKKTKRSPLWIPQKNLRRKKKGYLGVHLIADFWNGRIIEDEKEIEKILIKAAKEAKNTPLEISIHKFNPQGVTAVLLLSESHIAIHTWPELNYVAVDIFTCGQKSSPSKALEYLKKKFKPNKVQIKEIKRGK